jgi:type II secretion system protein N
MTGRLPWSIPFEFKKETLLWVLAGLFSFVLFLILTFPYGALQSRVLSELRHGTGWEVRAAEWSTGFPVAVEWHDLSLAKPGIPTIQLEAMRVAIPLLAQLTGQRSLEGTVKLPGSNDSGAGRLSGTVTASSWSFQGPTILKSHAQQVDLALIAKPYVTRGLLQADVTQRWLGTPTGAIEFKGDGTWRAEIKDLVLEHIPIGSTTLPSLMFNRVTLGLACRDATCDVTEFKGDGPDGSITAQGQLQLQQPLPQTMLDLTVTVIGGSGWAQKSAGLPLPPLPPSTPITFKLVGSVANPRISV